VWSSKLSDGLGRTDMTLEVMPLGRPPFCAELRQKRLIGTSHNADRLGLGWDGPLRRA
jgi:hypothetical protein